MTKSIEVTRNDCAIPMQEPFTHTLLIVDDDEPLLQCLARAMEARGFKVTTAESVANGLAQIKLSAPEYAVVDMRLTTAAAWTSFRRSSNNGPMRARSFRRATAILPPP